MMLLKRKELNFYGKQGIIDFKIIIILIFFPTLCFGSNNNRQDTTITYDLLQKTSSEFIVKKKNVQEEETKGNYFVKKIYYDKNLKFLKYYNKNGELFQNDYYPAIVEFGYDKKERINSVSIFDKNQNKTIDEYRDFHTIRFFYNEKDRIVKEKYYNIENNLLEYDKEIEIQAPIIEYIYELGTIIIKEYDQNNKLIREYEGEGPCIPYFNCK